MIELVNGRNDGVSNADYHGDRRYLSSSALKLLHKSPQDFYKKYILGEKEVVTNEAALTFGTCAHVIVLEPHLIESEIVVYPGKVRAGKEFQKFKEEHAGKNILIQSEVDKLMLLYDKYTKDHNAVRLMQGTEVEATYCSTIDGFPVKVRCDAINKDTGVIVDIKTTSKGNNVEEFKDACAQLYYDLSAALYCDVCADYYGRPFDFYFVVLSKKDNNCKTYKASKEMLERGRLLIKEAIAIYNRCKESGVWEHSAEDLLDVDAEMTYNDNEIPEV